MHLKPYTGPHAGSLYHVVDDGGRAIRNASKLEVDLWVDSKRLAARALEAINQMQELIPAFPHSDGRDEFQKELSELAELCMLQVNK